MTIIVFLVDNSGSANQLTYMGTSLLDMMKSAIESFMKMRSRDPHCRWDRYMLLTFEDPPANIKAAWKDSHATLITSLKNLKGGSLTVLGPALKSVFDLLNVNRMQSCVDGYGQGRCPFYLEPALIICFTDGGIFTTFNSASRDLELPMVPTLPGSELTREPFRWDQKLFGVTLKIPAVAPRDPSAQQPALSDTSSFDAMCEVTGGRSYVVSTKQALTACMDSILRRAQVGVVVSFMRAAPLIPHESIMPPVSDGRKVAPPSGWDSVQTTLYVPRNVDKGIMPGNWPIPESYWPDLKAKSLVPRDAHPTLRFSVSPTEPVRMEGLPIDKYELEPCALSRYIIDRAQPHVCWQVSVDNSFKYADTGLPFGYLRVNNTHSVHLYVLAYNYPVLLPLLGELKELKGKPTPRWKQTFDNYLKSMPIYYTSHLRKVLTKMKFSPALIPDSSDNCLGYSVSNYLKEMVRCAKNEHERITASVGAAPAVTHSLQVTPKSAESLLGRVDFQDILSKGGDVSLLSSLKGDIQKYESFTIAAPTSRKPRPGNPRNPFDVPSDMLLSHVQRLRQMALRPNLKMAGASSTAMFPDERHSVPILQMSNYQEYAKRAPTPLRELDTQPERLNTFGNPFKVNKNLLIDEADDVPMARPDSPGRKRQASDSPSRSPSPFPQYKRKAGPLPRDTPLKRPRTPSVSSAPSSPAHPAMNGDVVAPMQAAVEGAKVPSATPLHLLSGSRVGGGEGLSVIGDGRAGSTPLSVVGANGRSALTNGGVELPRGPVVENGEETSDLWEGDGRAGGSLASGQSAVPNGAGGERRLGEAGDVAEYNCMLVKTLTPELRKPGRNYDLIFQRLNTVRGDLRQRMGVVHQLKLAASRHKKLLLIRLLGQFEQSMINREQTLASDGGSKR